MLTRLRNRAAAVMLMALAAVFMALPAMASTPAEEAAVNTAVSDAASTATSVVTTNIPIILGVAVLWVALRYGKRLLAKF